METLSTAITEIPPDFAVNIFKLLIIIGTGIGSAAFAAAGTLPEYRNHNIRNYGLGGAISATLLLLISQP